MAGRDLLRRALRRAPIVGPRIDYLDRLSDERDALLVENRDLAAQNKEFGLQNNYLNAAATQLETRIGYFRTAFEDAESSHARLREENARLGALRERSERSVARLTEEIAALEEKVARLKEENAGLAPLREEAERLAARFREADALRTRIYVLTSDVQRAAERNHALQTKLRDFEELQETRDAEFQERLLSVEEGRETRNAELDAVKSALQHERTQSEELRNELLSVQGRLNRALTDQVALRDELAALPGPEELNLLRVRAAAVAAVEGDMDRLKVETAEQAAMFEAQANEFENTLARLETRLAQKGR